MDPAQPDSRQPPESSSLQQMPPDPPRGRRGVRMVLVRAIALFLLIVLVIVGLVWLVTIPVFSAGQGLGSTGSAPQVTPTPPADSLILGTTAPAPAGTIEPLPRDLEVFVSIQPKDSAGHVTVQFEGGRGRALVKAIDARLTRPDGAVATGSMNMQTEFPEVTLQGSKGTDRVEVFVRFLSGKTYKVSDDQVPYRRQI
jgi:hypothetical protein